LPRRPAVGAFTATATQAVREDILRLLALRDPVCQVTGFDRPNLYFDVLRPKKKDEVLSRLLLDRAGKSGIVYCATRAAVDQVCQNLRDQGVAATRYHAGLPEQERRQNQEDFQYDRCPVMVATNAFGMGIDKSNVSFVIHYNMPKSVEAYYQEAGRAGRDGSPADCILLYAPGDVTTARFLLQNSGENDALTPQERAEVARQDTRRLEAMVGYCKTTDCLRGYLLDYFGQEHDDNCGNCGNCRGMFALEDVTVPAQMILSCVRRIYDALGYDLGAGLVIQVLRGSRSQRVRELGLDRLSTYGLMKNVPRERIQTILDFLESRGYLRTHPIHRSVHLTGKAREVLFDGVRVELPVRLTAPAPRKEKEKPARRPAPEATGLFGVLKALRTRLAQQERVPAYIIFTNATLEDMAARCPRTMEEMGEVSGVGQKKLEKYGEIFLRAIADYEKG
ncbi:MAG: RecQ family ATP-dependent DNA helicase, partial [Evtepia sp.]